ncbi:MAG: ATP-binding protein [Deltaproteobacteria bacterium]|nr:ATP-binding protein [Deltaproteobacteria bacterium]
MKLLPSSNPDFSSLINSNRIYVDKSQYIYNLISADDLYFLSRPRRFGKTLLTDTLDCLFKGRQDLFKGLWIDSTGYGWKPYPVINISFGDVYAPDLETFKSYLMSKMTSIARKEGLSIPDTVHSSYFESLISGLSDKYNTEVVLLIDEYDAPVVKNILNEDLADKIRALLKSFYGVIKTKFKSLHFVFITGVSKFTKTSLFSELNNLNDITLNSDYSNICGITEAELVFYFQDYFPPTLEELLKINKLPPGSSETDLLIKIRHFYDGYSWDGETRVYNPWSLMNFFRKKSFDFFWYESGSPTFLIKLLKERKVSFNFFDKNNAINNLSNAIDIGQFTPEALAFQTGYLTVDKADFTKDPTGYSLKIPNFEVERSLIIYLLHSDYPGMPNIAAFTDLLESKAKLILQAILEKDALKAAKEFNSFMASFSYSLHLPYEAYYMTLFYFVFNLTKQNLLRQESVSGGILDCALEAPNGEIFVFEMKYARSAKKVKAASPAADNNEKPVKSFKKIKLSRPEISRTLGKAVKAAMKQIEDNKYPAKYWQPGRTVYQVAIAVCGSDNVRFSFKEYSLPAD